MRRHYTEVLMEEHNFDLEDIFEVTSEYDFGNQDFMIGEFRFIREDYVADLVKESMDPYVLSMFSASFLANSFNIPSDLIEVIQRGNVEQSFGEWLQDHENYDDFIKDWINSDGDIETIRFSIGTEEVHEIQIEDQTYYLADFN